MARATINIPIAEAAVYRAIIRALVEANDTHDGAVGTVRSMVGPEAALLCRDALEEAGPFPVHLEPDSTHLDGTPRGMADGPV